MRDYYKETACKSMIFIDVFDIYREAMKCCGRAILTSLGAGGRKFESCLPDQTIQVLTIYFVSAFFFIL
jgi:hypothetical protein